MSLECIIIGRSRRRGYALKEVSYLNNAVDSIVKVGIIYKYIRIE